MDRSSLPSHKYYNFCVVFFWFFPAPCITVATDYRRANEQRFEFNWQTWTKGGPNKLSKKRFSEKPASGAYLPAVCFGREALGVRRRTIKSRMCWLIPSDRNGHTGEALIGRRPSDVSAPSLHIPAGSLGSAAIKAGEGAWRAGQTRTNWHVSAMTLE